MRYSSDSAVVVGRGCTPLVVVAVVASAAGFVCSDTHSYSHCRTPAQTNSAARILLAEAELGRYTSHPSGFPAIAAVVEDTVVVVAGLGTVNYPRSTD